MVQNIELDVFGRQLFVKRFAVETGDLFVVLLVRKVGVVVVPRLFDDLEGDTVYHPGFEDRVGRKKEAGKDYGRDDEDVAVYLCQLFMEEAAYRQQDDVPYDQKDQDIAPYTYAGAGYLPLKVKPVVIHLIGFEQLTEKKRFIICSKDIRHNDLIDKICNSIHVMFSFIGLSGFSVLYR